jgi:hypothetical protein
MQRWEYAELSHSGRWGWRFQSSQGEQSFEEATRLELLNRLGAEGWELVTYWQDEHGDRSWTFKRPQQSG